MKERGEQVRSPPLSPADSAGCAHSGKTPSCTPRASPPGYVYVTTPHRSEERARTRRKRRRAERGLPASQLTAPAEVKGTWEVLHSWDEGELQEARSAAWRGRSVWCWSSPLCDQ